MPLLDNIPVSNRDGKAVCQQGESPEQARRLHVSTLSLERLSQDNH